MNSNTNCLNGFKCPKCKSLGPFWIGVQAAVLMFDDGSDQTKDIEWTDDSHCQCVQCSHPDKVKNFKALQRQET